MLHNDKEIFEQVVLKTSETLGVDTSIVEKDYFVTLFLQKISSQLPTIIFKGGTSLSKCHKLIKRFSEDIDLNIECETKPTEGQRKKLKKTIISIIEDLGLQLNNSDNIRSRRDFNRYIIDFPAMFRASSLKQHLIVETAVYIKAYPNNTMQAASMIYEFLSENGFHDLISKYNLEPFKLMVQSAERTFVDKVFAICDYYLDGRINEHSRHLYDLYKLLDVVCIDDNLRELVISVREERKIHKTCLSAQDNININDLLNEIIEKSIYKSDYESITELLLFEKVSYDEVIQGIKRIYESKLF
ncbi:MAG: nucleotidyl transferase AbiEii/AbiGii toxin family protein [Clostridia bacterium]|nr:nucleotidyl transferase AbiEii/AbiGii toxin family protein [Clostridia bacterium]